MDKHVQESVNRLVAELVGSSAGSAMRRVAFQARPGSLLPPAAVRSALVRVARASFASSIAQLSPRSLVAAMVSALRLAFGRIFRGKKKERDDSVRLPHNTLFCLFLTQNQCSMFSDIATCHTKCDEAAA